MAREKRTVDETLRRAQKDEQDIRIVETLDHIKIKILVMSGKGGVGKSSVAAYLAVTLARRGPPWSKHTQITGTEGGIQPSFHHEKAMPNAFSANLHVISIEYLMGENKDLDPPESLVNQYISDTVQACTP
jgi:ATP-binding protein involved in chromosome partitioning